jgi:hypothetical protein
MEAARLKQEYLKFKWSKFILCSEFWIRFDIQLEKSDAKRVLERGTDCACESKILHKIVFGS